MQVILLQGFILKVQLSTAIFNGIHYHPTSTEAPFKTSQKTTTGMSTPTKKWRSRMTRCRRPFPLILD